MNRSQTLAGLTAAALLLGPACFANPFTTYTQEMAPTVSLWKTGRFAECEKLLRPRFTDKKAASKDGIINGLELGAALRAAGKYEESNAVFDKVDDLIKAQESQAKVRLDQEILSIATNPEQTPYRAHTYDGIMVNTYKFLNFLALNNIENARVELKRAEERQIDAVELNKKRIAKAQEELEKNQSKQNVSKVMESPEFKEQIKKTYSDLDTLQPYGVYENPLTVYLDGLFNMSKAVSAGELDRARFSIDRASKFATNNSSLKRDAEALSALSSGKAVPPTTYILFEAGNAPIFNEVKLQVPDPINGGPMPLVYPVLAFDRNPVPGLSISASGKVESTELLSSMESVIGIEFKNDLSTLIPRTILSSFGKAGMVKGATAGNAIAGLVTRVASQAIAHADCRTWNLLSKEFQSCSIPTPADRQIQISPKSGGPSASVTVGEGHFNLVYVRSITSGSPLLISQIKLK